MKKLITSLIVAGMLVSGTKIANAANNKFISELTLQNKKSNGRLTLKTPNLDFIALNSQINNKTENLCLRTTARTDSNAILGGQGGLTLRYNNMPLGKEYNISPSMNFSKLYIEPCWLRFDQNGDLQKIGQYISANSSISNLKLIATYMGQLDKKAQDIQASYVSIGNKHIGAGIGEDCSHTASLMFGWNKNEKPGTASGGFHVLTYNHKNSNWTFMTEVGQNAQSRLTPSGPQAYADPNIITFPDEIAAYPLALAERIASGLAGKVSFGGTNSDVTSAYGEIGYNTGNGISCSISDKYDFSNSTSTLGGTVTYKTNSSNGGGIKLEAQVRSDNTFALYGTFNVSD